MKKGIVVIVILLGLVGVYLIVHGYQSKPVVINSDKIVVTVNGQDVPLNQVLQYLSKK